jgi:dihydroflavonol-4-reductase
MATLVTVDPGFLGSYIVRKLVQRGERVRILLRKTSAFPMIEDLDIERVYGDILDSDSVREALRGCDTLYHVAGFVSSKRADYKTMEDVNVKGAVNVLSAALEAGVKKVVYTCSASAVGIDPSGGVANEETPFTIEHMGIQYANTRHHAEKEALKLYEKGLPLVIVNPTVIIGPDMKIVSTGTILWYCKRKLWGYMDGGLNLVDVEDVAEGHILAAERGRVGERYILGNRNFRLEEVFGLMEKITGIPSPKRKIPYSMAITVAFFAERIFRLPSPRYVALDVDSIKSAGLYWYFDNSKAVRELGFNPTPIEESLEKIVRWLKDNGYLDN